MTWFSITGLILASLAMVATIVIKIYEKNYKKKLATREKL